MEYQIEDEIIETDDSWDCEFEPDEVDQVPALKALEIDADLCEVVKILKSDDGRFFAAWEERHPELGTFDEYFPKDERSRRFAERTEARLEEWRELERRMPSMYYSEQISRQDAYAIIAWFWLPREFHALKRDCKSLDRDG